MGGGFSLQPFSMQPGAVQAGVHTGAVQANVHPGAAQAHVHPHAVIARVNILSNIGGGALTMVVVIIGILAMLWVDQLRAFLATSSGLILLLLSSCFVLLWLVLDKQQKQEAQRARQESETIRQRQEERVRQQQEEEVTQRRKEIDNILKGLSDHLRQQWRHAAAHVDRDQSRRNQLARTAANNNLGRCTHVQGLLMRGSSLQDIHDQLGKSQSHCSEWSNEFAVQNDWKLQHDNGYARSVHDDASRKFEAARVKVQQLVDSDSGDCKRRRLS